MGQAFQRTTTGGLNQAKNFKLAGVQYDGYAVTPDDANDLPNGPCDAIYVTGAGNVAINLPDAGTAVLTTLGAGQIVDCTAQRIKNTSTTATGIFALYRVGT
jgi:hypothetical protein